MEMEMENEKGTKERKFLVYRQKNQCNWKADYQHHNNNDDDDDECFTCGTKKQFDRKLKMEMKKFQGFSTRLFLHRDYVS